MTIEELNKLPEQIFREEMMKCCGSSKWTELLNSSRPFQDLQDLMRKADEAWEKTDEKDWLEAYSHHPKIGDLKSLEKKFASTKEMAGAEQASVKSAGSEILEALATGNSEYERKFGFIFIVCATGKSAEEMLYMLNERMRNEREKELKIAASEQHKITKLRLQKLLA
jgi:2-oxo-4-hydroxy-4-carboxy-5-ureidoimidazoline decarboxylase